MIKYITQAKSTNFTWIDITNPTLDDFDEIKEKFNISTASIQDSIEIGNLPKIEKFENYHFLIIRSIKDQLLSKSSVITDITNRISILYNKDFIITAHRNDIPFLDRIIHNEQAHKKIKSSKALVNTLVSEALNSFEIFAIDNVTQKLGKYEEMVFQQQGKKTTLKNIYYIKRQIDSIRNILTFYKEIVDYFHMPEYENLYTQDLKDSYYKSEILFKNLSENTSQLLSVYFNLESNHTNEIMRLLTIISVFFMPITFVTGLYGMNFDFMPGTKSPYGYMVILGIMLSISVIIYYLFKRKKWL